MGSEFQAKPQELRNTLQLSNPKKFAAERAKLFLTVQKEVLPHFGFEPTPRGVYAMMPILGTHQWNPEFNELTIKVNYLLGLDVNGQTLPPENPTTPAEGALAAIEQPEEQEKEPVKHVV